MSFVLPAAAAVIAAATPLVASHFTGLDFNQKNINHVVNNLPLLYKAWRDSKSNDTLNSKLRNGHFSTAVDSILSQEMVKSNNVKNLKKLFNKAEKIAATNKATKMEKELVKEVVKPNLVPRKVKQNKRNYNSNSKTEQVTVKPMSTAVYQSFRSKRPFIKHVGDSVMISHTEFVQDIMGNTGEGVSVGTAINPSNPSMFPWLSTIANSYESFRFAKLEFVYIPIAIAGGKGYITMALDYDVVDSTANLTRQVITSFDRAITASVVGDHPTILHFAPKAADRVKWWYTNPSFSTGPTDTAVQDYFPANLITLVSKTDDATTQGQLLVRYSITLKTPHVYNFGIDKTLATFGVHFVTPSSGTYGFMNLSGVSIQYEEPAPNVIFNWEDGRIEIHAPSRRYIINIIGTCESSSTTLVGGVSISAGLRVTGQTDFATTVATPASNGNQTGFKLYVADYEFVTSASAGPNSPAYLTPNWTTGTFQEKIIYLRVTVRDITNSPVTKGTALDRFNPSHYRIFKLNALRSEINEVIDERDGIPGSSSSAMSYPPMRR